MATIAILGTMDSKGAEHAFVAERIRERGHQVFIIDVGTLGEPKLKPDITREQVAVASGNTAQYVGVKDIVMFPSIVDVAGLNRISRQILTRAAGAICGMVEVGVSALAGAGGATLKRELQPKDKPVIVASMFGNTTQ